MKLEDPVLDVGCGTGENSIFLVKQGLRVTGIDASPNAIRIASTKTSSLPNVTFYVRNLFQLSPEEDGCYNTIIDSGVFHIFNPHDRILYQNVLYKILNPNGLLIFLVFNDHEPTGFGPPFRISKEDIYSTFISEKWIIEAIIDAEFELAIRSKVAKAYLTILRKI